MRDLLMGIFLAVASIWAVILGQEGSGFLMTVGLLLLPLLALIYAVKGYLSMWKPKDPGDGENSENPENPDDPGE